MASRREQKEQLRREREAREAAARANKGRQRLVGYAVGGAVVLIAVIVGVVLLGGGGGGDASADVLPDGGDVPEIREDADLKPAAEAAGCELDSYLAKGRSPHSTDINEKIKWPTKPPAGGRHYQEWADDSAYETAPNINMLVHTLEHGRIIVWFKKSLPSDARAALKAYYDEDSYQMVLTPDNSGMKYEVAATAWNRDPDPDGTGRLLGCPKYNNDVFTAIEAFKDEHRSRGPEPVP